MTTEDGTPTFRRTSRTWEEFEVPPGDRSDRLGDAGGSGPPRRQHTLQWHEP